MAAQMTKSREQIVSSAAFIKLFKKARAKMRNQSKLCNKGLHPICAANAHVGDVRGRCNLYSCYPCWRAANSVWMKSEAGKAAIRKWWIGKGRFAYRRWAKSPKQQARCRADNASSRARKLGIAGSFTGAQFLAVCDKFNNRCLCCGKWKPLSPDHVLPLRLGGLNVIGNIQPLCLTCNISKHAGTTDYRKNPHKNCLLKSKWRAPRLVRRALPNWIKYRALQPAPAQSIEAELGIA